MPHRNVCMDMEQMVRFCRECSLLTFRPKNGILGQNTEMLSIEESSMVDGFTVQILMSTLLEMRAHHRSVARRAQYDNRLLRGKEIESMINIENEFKEIKEKKIDKNVENNSNRRSEKEMQNILSSKYVTPSLFLNATVSDIMDSSVGPSSSSSSSSTFSSSSEYDDKFIMSFLFYFLIFLPSFTFYFSDLFLFT